MNLLALNSRNGNHRHFRAGDVRPSHRCHGAAAARHRTVGLVGALHHRWTRDRAAHHVLHASPPRPLPSRMELTEAS